MLQRFNGHHEPREVLLAGNFHLREQPDESRIVRAEVERERGAAQRMWIGDYISYRMQMKDGREVIAKPNEMAECSHYYAELPARLTIGLSNV